MLYIRDEDRYGKFLANSNIGMVEIHISIHGFGDQIEIYQDGEYVTSNDSSDFDWDYINDDYYDPFDETEEKLSVNWVEVYKPFVKKIERS